MELETHITNVEVYTDRACVTRTGKVTLEKGNHRLAVSKLISDIDTDSVRAAARGTARARMLGADVQPVFFDDIQADEVRALRDTADGLQDEMDRLDARIQLAENEYARLGALLSENTTFARGMAFGKIKAAEQMSIFDALNEKLEKAQMGVLDLSFEKRRLARRLKKAQKDLDKHRQASKREGRTIFVEIEVTEAGELTIEISYVVHNASWKPLYDLRVIEEGGKTLLEVGYLAQISQETGVAWEDAEVTLSTARPALAGVTPKLAPWYVSEYTDVSLGAPVMAKAQPAPAADCMAVLEDVFEEPAPMIPEIAAETVQAEVASAGATVTYRIPGKLTVPSDGAPHKCTVASFQLSPELNYVAAPKLVEAVYRKASITNDSPYTLLPGSANLFNGNAFIGATSLNLVAPKGKFSLHLGVDDRIKIKRELSKKDVDKKIIRNKRVIHQEYKITLESALSETAKVTVHDQFPVANHEDIKTKLEAASPKPAKHTDLNLLEWAIDIQPAEKKTVTFEYSLQYPRQMQLVGL